MTEDCKRFEESLLELAYGELDESSASELRKHCGKCPSCAKLLEETMITRKLAAQLPLMAPGDDMDASILKAAASAAEEFAASNSSKPEPELSAKVLKRRRSFAERTKSLMLAPALATAAVAALVFVVTFFLYEKGPKRENMLKEEAQSSNTVETAPFEKPTAAPKAQGETANAEATQGALSAAAEAPTAQQAVSQDEASPEEEAKRARTSASGSRTGGPKSAQKKSGEQEQLPSGGQQAPQSPAVSLEKSAPSADFSEADDLSSSAGGAAYQENQAAKASAAPAASSDDAAGDFETGMQAYARGDCGTAIPALVEAVNQTPSSPTETPTAMHHIARCEKRRARYNAALPWYEKLLGRFPNYSHRPEALSEAAACYKKTGKTAAARARLEELSRIPGWEARAEQELEAL